MFERVRADYVDKPDDSKLVESAINGMLAGLDPHSSYMDPKSFRDMQVQTRGEFGGLGIEVTMEDGLIKVVAPIDDTPAAKAGVHGKRHHHPARRRSGAGHDPQSGRRQDARAGQYQDQAHHHAQGRRQADRADDHARHHPREIGALASRRRDVGYIRITQFNEQTTDGLKQSITDLKNQLGADKIKGYILDLRNNPGGLLDQAISVSNAFLDKGEIVSTRGRNADETQRFNARPGGDLTGGKPLIVLINGGSASASEIVAGALQDHKRATLVGTRSFGKGSVQTIIPLGAGNGALRLTTARYYTPSGRSIQAKGIMPDIEVLQDVPDELKERTDTKGEASLPGHLKAEGAEEIGIAVLRAAGREGRQGAQDGARSSARQHERGRCAARNCPGDQPKPAEHQATPDVGTAKPSGDAAAQPQRTDEGQLKTVSSSE